MLHVLTAIFLLMAVVSPAMSKEKTTLYFFWGSGCPHCNKEKIFLGHLQGKYPELEIKSYEVWYNLENAGLFARMAKAYGRKVEGVPVVFIGSFDPVVGYLNDETTGKLLDEKIAYCIENGCINPLDKTVRPPEQKEEPKEETLKPAVPKIEQRDRAPEQVLETERKPVEKVLPKEAPHEKEEVLREVPSPGKGDIPSAEPSIVKLPLFGEIDASKTSLPVLTVIIAGMDGFNPCAFFVLFLLLSILVYAHSRKVMLLIGGTFVFFSGLIYFLFMSAWLNIFLLFGHLKMITTVAGAVALVIAVINIKDFFLFQKGISLTIPDKAKPKLFERTRGLLKKSSLSSMMAGTVILAIAANTYELLCTAGFPMVYTRALTLQNLPTLEYYLYLLFYNVIYVIPLTAIVLMFTITLGAKKLTERQGQVLKLISGMMMLSLGVVLLSKPDLLNNVIVSAGLLAVSLMTSGLVVFITRLMMKGNNA